MCATLRHTLFLQSWRLRTRKDAPRSMCSEHDFIQYFLGDPLDIHSSNVERCTHPPFLQSQPEMKCGVYIQRIFPLHAQQLFVVVVNRQYVVGIANVNLCEPSTMPFPDYHFNCVFDGNNEEQWTLLASSFTPWPSGDKKFPDKPPLQRCTLGNDSEPTKAQRSQHPATHRVENNYLLWSHVEWRHIGR